MSILFSFFPTYFLNFQLGNTLRRLWAHGIWRGSWRIWSGARRVCQVLRVNDMTLFNDKFKTVCAARGENRTTRGCCVAWLLGFWEKNLVKNFVLGYVTWQLGIPSLGVGGYKENMSWNQTFSNIRTIWRIKVFALIWAGSEVMPDMIFQKFSTKRCLSQFCQGLLGKGRSDRCNSKAVCSKVHFN